MTSRRVVLLDLDGTLTDPREGILDCFRHALRSVDAEPPSERDLLAWIGPPLMETFEAAFPGDRTRARRCVTAYRERFGTDGWRENKVIPGIPEALARLAEQGFELHVATSKLERFAWRIVEHFGFGESVGEVFGADEAGLRAAKPALIAGALEQLGCRAGDAVMVGDRKHDVLGARACGVSALGVTWGFGNRTELETAGADRIVDAPVDLADACIDLLPEG